MICEKRRTKEAKPKGPAVSHQRHHCLTWGEYVNVVFGSSSKNILLFFSVRVIEWYFTAHAPILPRNWRVDK